MSKGEAAPAAASEQPPAANERPPPASEQGSRNLVMRVVAALVLAPVAIGLAYLGGVTSVAAEQRPAIGLFVEMADDPQASCASIMMLVLVSQRCCCAGLCLIAGRPRRGSWLSSSSASATIALLSGAQRNWACKIKQTIGVGLTAKF